MKPMRKKFVLLLLSFFSFCVQAQTTEHLKFKGVPIDGTLETFIEQLKTTGFKLSSSQNGTAFFTGDFAGIKDCKVGVSVLSQKNLVYKISVMLPYRSIWLGLHGDYVNLKSMLIEKYGKPTNETENFQGGNSSLDDNSKMHLVKFDGCDYNAVWETKNGSIQISISHNDLLQCFVKIGYFDKVNGEIIKSKSIDDL